MSAVSDEYNSKALLGKASRLPVDLSHQRTGRIDDLQFAPPGRIFHTGRDAVSAIHEPTTDRHVIQIVHKDHAARSESLYDVTVMDDFVVHKQWSAESFQRQLQCRNGHVHTGAEPARASQDDFH